MRIARPLPLCLLLAFGFAFAFVLGVPAAGPAQERGDGLVVLTFNVRSGRGPARAAAFDPGHLQALVALINEVGPDVVFIQELDRGIRRTESTDQFALIEEGTGLEGRFAGTLERGGGIYGIAMFSAHPIVDYRQIDLPQLGGKEPRALQVAAIEVPGGVRVDVLHTHIDFRLAARPDQIELVLGHARDLAEEPVILAGDFNAPDGSDEIASITSWWTDAAAVAATDPKNTYPTRDLRHRVDYVFFRGDSLDLGSVEYPDNRGISDHVPIVARFRILAH